MNFFQSLLFGFLSGLTEILPVSAQAHKAIMLTIFGAEGEPGVLRLALHLAVLAALFVSSFDYIRRIRRQLQLAKVPKRRRKRPLDVQVLMDVRLLRMTAVPVILCFLFYQSASSLSSSLNWIALLALVNAMILFVPNLMPTGNKDSRSLSSMEGLLMGLGSALGILPGISSVGCMMSVASVCGVERKFALDMTLLVQMIVTVMMIFFDVLALVSGVGTLDTAVLLGYLAAAVAAFCGARLAVRIMRNVVVRGGLNSFAFYSLAVAFLSFIFYLMV